MGLSIKGSHILQECVKGVRKAPRLILSPHLEPPGPDLTIKLPARALFLERLLYPWLIRNE